MRLAIIGDELDQNLDRVIDVVSTNEFHGIEVRSVWNTQPDKLTHEQLEKIRDSIKKAGLAVAGFDSPCLKTVLPRTDAELEASRNSILHAIEQARLLDAGFVRIFTFYREGEANPKLAAEVAKRILDGIIPDDIQIYVETGMRTNTPTMQHMLQFLDVIGDNRLGVVWDPGNSVFAGADKNPFPADYEAGKELIKHVHIKDPIGQQEYTRLGDGDLPWPEIIRTLYTDDYKGYLSLETHWRIGRVLDQNQRDNPWFDTFSENGYEASVECMQQLLNYVREIL
ncbi:MAG: sugar phosphate isomerase/epimerase [Alicyclobacillus sp.]|nr:sugar phosphate isomerase/epimerase [Alicyclobacillus sp.]